MFAFTGTASAPPAGAPVRILDAEDANQVAHVDANGNLQVGGTVGIDSVANTVTLDSSTPVEVTSADDPGRMAFQEGTSLTVGPGQFFTTVHIDVPAGRRLVITQVSGVAELPSGQKLLFAGVGEATLHVFVPTFTGTSVTGDDIFTFSQDTMMFADSQVNLRAVRNDNTGSVDADFSVSGYLIDCLVAECN
jgi:hypothetical protein